MTDFNPKPNRRAFAAMAALAAAGLAGIASAAEAQEKATPAAADRQPADGNPEPLRIGLVLFPRLTAMDLVGPQLIMHLMGGTECHLVAQTPEPVVSDSNLPIVPTATFAHCPENLDILFVPGGPTGTEQALRNDVLLDFVAEHGARARYVTSVCTGSMILAAAGLLDGYKAASHWMTRDLLPIFGVTPVDERVVIDRNRMTGGGITAGLDFGLVLAAQLRGEERARLVQLILEYDPEPPFRSGSMKTARQDTILMAQGATRPSILAIRAAAENARTRRKG